jgi:molecular chaperone HtpG
MLFFTDDIDEFAIKMLMKYKDKEFKSVSSGDLGIEEEAKEKKDDESETEHKELFEAMKLALTDKVKEVRASKRLRSHPVCLSAAGDLSIEMEKVLQAMPNNSGVKAEKILEINVNHEVFQALKQAHSKDQEKFGLYTSLLYHQALLIEGLPVQDPVQFTNDICKVMVS